MDKIQLLDYDEVLKRLPQTKHLLLGNGFSIACDKIFNYPNLFDYAKENGLTKHVQEVFNYFGTNNFEGVMMLLEDSIWITKHYGLVPEKNEESSIRKDLVSIKKALVYALVQTHLSDPNKISDKRKENCVNFLKPYKNIFTTNYDLLLYWISMYGKNFLQEQDGFRSSIEDPNAEYLTFQEHIGRNNGILFLHGALHLYVENGEVRKHCWVRSNKPLIQLIKEGLDKKQYPLFVAEGLSEKKLIQINHNCYLSYCMGKLDRIEKSLVIYGMSLGSSDQHIIDLIAGNPKLENVYIGLYEEQSTQNSHKVINAAKKMIGQRNRFMHRNATYAKELHIDYYDSKTVKVWD